MLRSAGYTARQLHVEAKRSCAELKAVGWGERASEAACFGTCSEAKQAGYTCSEAKQVGYTCAQAKAAGWLPFDLITCVPYDWPLALSAAVSGAPAGATYGGGLPAALLVLRLLKLA